MVSTVNKKIIEMILNREMKFTDFNFKPETWYDAFIVELLKWYDNKIEEIYKKYEFRKDLFDENKIYYEQLVRILYYFVIYMNIQDYKQLYNNLRYLFIDEKDDKHNDPKMLRNLIELYEIIIKDIPNLKKDYRDNEYIDVFIDKWNDIYMHNKLNIIEDHNKVRDRITYIIDNFDKINSKDYKSEDEEIILKFLKDFFNDFNEIDSIKNIGVNKKLELCKDYYNEFKRLPKRSDVYKDFKIGLFVDHFKRGCNNSHLKEEVENIFNTKIE